MKIQSCKFEINGKTVEMTRARDGVYLNVYGGKSHFIEALDTVEDSVTSWKAYMAFQKEVWPNGAACEDRCALRRFVERALPRA